MHVDPEKLFGGRDVIPGRFITQGMAPVFLHPGNALFGDEFHGVLLGVLVDRLVPKLAH